MFRTDQIPGKRINATIKNVILNKLQNTSVFLGDVKNIVPKLKKKYDRILMPLPKTADEYLNLALRFLKDGGAVHFYAFQRDGEEKKLLEKIKKTCTMKKKKCRILKSVKCCQSGPGEYRVCIDFKVY